MEESKFIHDTENGLGNLDVNRNFVDVDSLEKAVNQDMSSSNRGNFWNTLDNIFGAVNTGADTAENVRAFWEGPSRSQPPQTYTQPPQSQIPWQTIGLLVVGGAAVFGVVKLATSDK